MKNIEPFGEIIASSLTSWTIQSWSLDVYPPFGGLIQTTYDNKEHVGIMSDITTGPQNTHRTPFAFGKNITELKHEQPHIFNLLKTTITALPLSYGDAQGIIYEIPKRPAPIHSFTQQCGVQELNAFFSHTQWMITFFNLAQNHPLFDELLIALIRNAHQHEALSKERVQEIIDLFCLLTHDDYRKLKIFLQRIQAFIY